MATAATISVQPAWLSTTHAHNYQVLTPDLRACGDTDGNYLGMGWLDRKDILSWIDWIVAQDSDARIVIHGISMGAATTMMTAGEDTPDQVVAFVEDCGYTSVWDIFSSELKLRFGMPEFPLMYTANLFASSQSRLFLQRSICSGSGKKLQKADVVHSWYRRRFHSI